jgi:hypothetical protein
LISIDTSKELAFCTDSDYIIFIKLSVDHNNYEPEKNCLIFKKGGTPPKSHRLLIKIAPSDSAY